ncbi:putative repeat protein (TIGR03847 family) [Kineosphaera limosa]|uniref:DUF3090 domain-containing protein n=1 Tax=Kineosphaera limosa NBRC 100340 TaxID=1184609 RepID=K6VE95_9MICO|nr:DUF3090 domain-containing protein [Kineosphaera limosa]NYE03196.1 putative repeat protein (TIGR03847 family) [Kineosphaera limosa]GAB94533.1 hypothetical protein KILIM_005_01500 [Kineosphaera limosa NBRC 100340]
MALIAFDPPDRFVTGTVGPPGQRQFFLQATGSGRTTTVAVEKSQVQVLADRVNDLLDSFAGGAATEQAAARHTDNAPLDTPIEEEFAVGTMGLSWDPERERLVIDCHAAGDAFDTAEAIEGMEGQEEVDPATDPRQLVLRVVLDPAVARAFARRSVSVVSAGRPPCPFCSLPLDPEGHVCARANGYKR